MRNSSQRMGLASGKSLVALVALALAACSSPSDQSQAVQAEKPFAAAGKIEMQLESGNYVIRAASDDRIRVSFGGNIGDAAADLATNGTHANLVVKNTPHNNFWATVEVPKAADLGVRLAAGNLEITGITGNKDIDSKAGNVTISTSNPNDYASVDAVVKVGNLEGGPFGHSGSGLSPHLKWTGPGKYDLRANLGAGDLELKR